MEGNIAKQYCLNQPPESCEIYVKVNILWPSYTKDSCCVTDCFIKEFLWIAAGKLERKCKKKYLLVNKPTMNAVILLI